MYKFSLKLLILMALLPGCASINYQQRDEFTPEGYSESKLENGNYIVVYETFKKAGNQVSLEELALKRASELSQSLNKPYFEVISSSYEEYEDKVDIPEHTIYINYMVSEGGMPFGGSVTRLQETEAYIPAHTKTYNIKKISLTILLLTEQNQNSLFASDYLE